MAQVSLTTLDTAYTQNFDTLPLTGTATWTDNVTPLIGWYNERVTGATTTVAADTGSGVSGNLYSYGIAASSERALGTLNVNGTGDFFTGVRLANNTGSTITSLDIAYNGEQWRNGGNTTPQSLVFSYLVGSPAVTGSLAEFQLAGVPVTALDFTSPIATASAGALNGNLAANRTAKTFTITGLSIPNGTEVMLRWFDHNESGNDHGLAIDDFSVTPHGSSPLPSLSINDATVTEGNAGTVTATFTVSLSAPAGPGGVSFNIATADNTATAPSDYTTNALTSQTIPAGSSTFSFNVLVNGDTLPETNETFFVNVTSVTGASVLDGQGVGTITNDDAAPSLSIADVSHNEGNAGTTTYTFTVSLDQPAPAGGVTFDIATANGTATAPSDYTARTLTAQTIPAGSSTYTFNVLVNGDFTTEPDETFTVNVTNVSNAILLDGQATGTIVNDDLQKIHDLQGNGAATPIPGASVVVEGVVTANFLGSTRLSGFFLQEEDADADADPNTSEGIFVFCSACAANAVVEGQRVRVSGTVSEFQGMTELTSATAAGVVVTDAGNHLAEVTPSPITLPIVGDVDAFYEAREGMLVTYTDTLSVSEYFELFRFGQIELVQGDRPRTYTEDNAPSVSGYATHLQDLARRHVILDDDNNAQEAPLLQPDGSQFVYYPRANGGFSVGTQGVDFFRGGDKVNGLTGVLQWSFPGFGANTWRLRPTNAHPATFTVANPRPVTPPNVGGSIRAVGMNLLNYFTTIDTTSSSSAGPCGPSGGQDCRGADSAAELVRQRERASIVVCTLNPDVAAFMELENTTPSDTINDILGAVNARCGGVHPYAFINTGGTLGTDAIRVMLIYRTGVLSPVGAVLTDMDPIHNRPPTAQTFDVVDASSPAFGKRFTVIANHFKSKGSCPTSGADTDQLDGQSCWAATRTQQATRLLTWINGTVIPAAGDPDVLLLGDFNSYAHETPVTTIEAGGYHDLETELHGTSSYSYLFSGELGHLDFAFASASFASQITGADAWHINADEADLFDYNDEIKDVGESTFEEKPDGSALVPPRVVFQPGTPYRASDHDPVLVGLFGATDLAITVSDAPDPVTAGNNLAYTVTVTNNGPISADTVAWSDTLPAGTTFVSQPAVAGWSCTTPAVGAGGTISCSNPTLGVGSATFTMTVAVASSVANGTVLSNTASVTTTTGDTNPANNSATATTTVVAPSVGNLTITPTSAPFGNQVVGTTSASMTITLANTGNASLNVTTLTAPIAPFSRSGGSCSASTPITLAANASCTLSYAYSPTAMGPANQVLTVTANAPGSGTITLSGTGVQGGLTISPLTVSFGNQAVGTTSAPMALTLGNNGTSSLNVTALGTPSAPFARSGGTCSSTLPITIAAGGNCTVLYTFSPSAVGVVNRVVAVAANVPGSGSATLSGTGTTGSADVSVSIDDGRHLVKVGETLSYAIVVSNASGPSNATVTVGDALPDTLTGGSWTCTPSGAATCANGTGNVLSDVATLPVGSGVTYVYSATVQLGTSEVIANSATATLSPGVNDPNTANNTAVDAPADVIVLFTDGFDGGSLTQMLDDYGDGTGFVSAKLKLDAALLGTVGIVPVTIASGESADAKTMFTIELARFNGQYVMRLVSGSERSEWRAVDLQAQPLDFAWQSASAGKSDGYVRLAAGSSAVQSDLRGESEPLVRMRITLSNELAWLSMSKD